MRYAGRLFINNCFLPHPPLSWSPFPKGKALKASSKPTVKSKFEATIPKDGEK
jgi:hypothetical protein